MGRRNKNRQPDELIYREQSYRKTILPRNEKQKDYINALNEYPVVIASGSPGSGKTYLAVCHSVNLFEQNKIGRIIVTRPAVATEKLGYLPGNIQQKLDPYLRPIYDSLYDRWTPEKVDKMLEIGEIEIAPVAFLRGRTLSNAAIIIDEAQNTTPEQMKMILTRFGENVSVIITGDPTQSDILGENGLVWASRKLTDCPMIKVIRFENHEVVRSDLVKEILTHIKDD